MTRLTPLVAELPMVLQAVVLVNAQQGMHQRGADGGTPFSVTSIFPRDSSSFVHIDLTQEMLDKESSRKILHKIQNLEHRSQERNHHYTLLKSYPNDMLKGMEKM